MARVMNLGTYMADFLLSFVTPDHLLSSRQKWVFGLVNLISVVIFWVLSSFLVNDLLESDIYRKPFLITYINTSCFCFYLIPYFRYEGLSIQEFVSRMKYDYHQIRLNHLASPSLEEANEEEQTELRADYGSNDDLASTMTKNEPEQINIYETCKLSLQFVILWFGANLVTNASLSYTSVALQTILLSTASFFTLIIGYLCSIEKINSQKIIGIILSFIGVVIVTRVDSSSNTNNPPVLSSHYLVIWGNLLALLGALIYGIYTILLKFKIMVPNNPSLERNLNTHLFFGFVGVFCLIFIWPFIIILHFTNLEHFQLPPSSRVVGLILINAVITFISDFCWCKAVLLTSPLTVTVGLSLTIPLAMVGDWFIKGFVVNYTYLCGALIVTIGFLIINKDEENDFTTHED
ncbi:hypothetical protein HYPBUDRAFT_10452 [Hyphopichia burtonii NRRL Y-1933]|uniref:EamA domain-containing protein n=1 Tax=Hyphopichia burtonii NRRL Y-1933 TaxID=984485 RepID=A0A1E4RP45_9ASCO|nr:hypothetical protein HYPBUDRAFT_10452 [Hyphopichia burtonii NRRL Y-1933]ODV69044.1 hypothetical protein HYPBUDRAFT_10452 [Hyphopichia burtonii NRRL Y-1933]